MRILIITTLILLSSVNTFGQFNMSLELGGSANTFQATPADSRAAGSVISKSAINNYSIALRGGYLLKNKLEIGVGLSFNHYSDAYNNAFENFESDNFIGTVYLSYHMQMDNLVVSPGMAVGLGKYKPSVSAYDDGTLTRYSPELMIGYLLDNGRVQPFLSMKYHLKRIKRDDLSTGMIAEQRYEQNYLLLGVGIKYFFKQRI